MRTRSLQIGKEIIIPHDITITTSEIGSDTLTFATWDGFAVSCSVTKTLVTHG